MKSSEQDGAGESIKDMSNVFLTKVTELSIPDISIAITCWNMARELPRTLWSLSRAFQQGADDLTWEIIVIDNGSDCLPLSPVMTPAPRILAARHPAPSPVGAMNEALALARGQIIGAWIDGARMASPSPTGNSDQSAKPPRPCKDMIVRWKTCFSRLRAGLIHRLIFSPCPGRKSHLRQRRCWNQTPCSCIATPGLR
jgi:hypothetical protein